MLAKLLTKDGGRLTRRGQKVSDAIDTAGFLVLILIAFGVVGSIESGKWF
jgi:hypothetical protein